MTDSRKPVVLCVRNPDYANDYTVDGEVRIIDVDMGASFDGPKDFDEDDPEMQEWAAGHLREVADLPDDSNVRAAMVELIGEMIEGTKGFAQLLANELNEGVPVLQAFHDLCLDPEQVYSEDPGLALDDPDNDVIDFGFEDREGYVRDPRTGGLTMQREKWRECVVLKRFGGNWKLQTVKEDN